MMPFHSALMNQVERNPDSGDSGISSFKQIAADRREQGQPR